MAVPSRPAFEQGGAQSARMFLLVWGDSGCGKTTLAATAPGDKAFIQFDPQGTASIAHRPDYHVLDLSGYGATSCMMEFNTNDPFGMKRWINERPTVETVVIDSVTALAHLALQYAVTRAGGSSNMDVPGMNGYGVRNNVMRRVVVMIMQMCADLDKHLVAITHEAAPDRDTTGNVTSITMALSANLANDVSLRFNEVWWMKDTGSKHTLYLRPWSHYKPMKSRMFMTGTTSSFDWNYNADTLEGEGIADWFSQWQANGGRKIPLPTVGGAKK